MSNREEMLRMLRAEIDELSELTKRYPVEVEYASFRYVFESRAEVQKAIEELADESD